MKKTNNEDKSIISYDTKKLKILLLELYYCANKKIATAKINNILRKTPYERINVSKIDFEHNSFTYDWKNIEYYDYYDWSSYVLGDFLKDELKAGAEYEAVVAEICNVFNVPENATRNVGMYKFLAFIINYSPNGELNDNNIDLHLDIFINDYIILLNKSDYTWKIKLWLIGVKFEDLDDIITSNLLIRKPKKKEFTLNRPKLYHENDFERITGKHLISQCVLEFETTAPEYTIVGISNEKIENEIESWVDVFRLFKVGNITIAQQSASPQSISVYPETERPESPLPTETCPTAGPCGSRLHRSCRRSTARHSPPRWP